MVDRDLNAEYRLKLTHVFNIPLKDTTKPQTIRNHTETQAMNPISPTEDTLPSESDSSSENATSRVFVIDTAIMKHLPEALNSPTDKHVTPEFLKRVPFVVQRTIRVSKQYCFVFKNVPQM